ncbi:MAG TPA: hypothetical protein VMT35_12185, partial [Ignavibacteriaceae bacterium]|nr:hypothetical protein [Ignavibacteriaceae bacterium]
DYFNSVEVKYYYLLSLLAVPLRNRKSFEYILNFLNSIDQKLFKLNYIKRQAWQTIIKLSNPNKKSFTARI